MQWFSGESIFDRLFGYSPKDNEYYHCKKTWVDESYKCNKVYGDNHLIPVPANADTKKTLEEALKFPVTLR